MHVMHPRADFAAFCWLDLRACAQAGYPALYAGHPSRMHDELADAYAIQAQLAVGHHMRMAQAASAAQAPGLRPLPLGYAPERLLPALTAVGASMYASMYGHSHHGGLAAAHMQAAGAYEYPGMPPHGGHPAAPHSASAALGGHGTPPMMHHHRHAPPPENPAAGGPRLAVSVGHPAARDPRAHRDGMAEHADAHTYSSQQAVLDAAHAARARASQHPAHPAALSSRPAVRPVAEGARKRNSKAVPAVGEHAAMATRSPAGDQRTVRTAEGWEPWVLELSAKERNRLVKEINMTDEEERDLKAAARRTKQRKSQREYAAKRRLARNKESTITPPKFARRAEERGGSSSPASTPRGKRAGSGFVDTSPAPMASSSQQAAPAAAVGRVSPTGPRKRQRTASPAPRNMGAKAKAKAAAKNAMMERDDTGESDSDSDSDSDSESDGTVCVEHPHARAKQRKIAPANDVDDNGSEGGDGDGDGDGDGAGGGGSGGDDDDEEDEGVLVMAGESKDTGTH